MNGRRLDPGTATLLTITCVLLAATGLSLAADPEPDFQLGLPSPNPCNPESSIEFTLARPAHVALRIRDLNGSVVEDLLDGYFSEGTYQAHWRGDHSASGVFFFCLTVDGKTKVRRVTLLK